MQVYDHVKQLIDPLSNVKKVRMQLFALKECLHSKHIKMNYSIEIIGQILRIIMTNQYE